MAGGSAPLARPVAAGDPGADAADLPVAGCKDCSGDLNRLLEPITGYGGPLYVGSSAILALAGPLGCARAILGLADADPEGCIAAFGGDASAQRALAVRHARSSSFPLGVKKLAAERFGTSTVTRMG